MTAPAVLNTRTFDWFFFCEGFLIFLYSAAVENVFINMHRGLFVKPPVIVDENVLSLFVQLSV